MGETTLQTPEIFEKKMDKRKVLLLIAIELKEAII